MAKFLVMPIAYLLTNLASACTKICSILLIILLLYSGMIVVVILKLLYKVSKATAIAIQSQMFLV